VVNRPERWFDLVCFALLSNRYAQYGFAVDLVRGWFDFGSILVRKFRLFLVRGFFTVF
jgi:hypothetical protein